MVWSPLAGGILSGKFRRDAEGPEGARRSKFDFPPVDKDLAFTLADAMREIGAAHGASAARVALAWVLSRPFVTSVITGVKTLDQLNDNLAAADLVLTASDIARLDELSALKPEYPGWMVERQNDPRRNPNTK
jgi:aryl-alcohol dehydrogenase-like predicted oxidoreductase